MSAAAAGPSPHVALDWNSFGNCKFQWFSVECFAFSILDFFCGVLLVADNVFSWVCPASSLELKTTPCLKEQQLDHVLDSVTTNKRSQVFILKRGHGARVTILHHTQYWPSASNLHIQTKTIRQHKKDYVYPASFNSPWKSCMERTRVNNWRGFSSQDFPIPLSREFPQKWLLCFPRKSAGNPGN